MQKNMHFSPNVNKPLEALPPSSTEFLQLPDVLLLAKVQKNLHVDAGSLAHRITLNATMTKPKLLDLSRREREILEIIYRLGPSTAAEVQAELDDEPNYSAVRGVLSSLEKKKHLRIERDGVRYVYHPTVAREAASRKVLDHVIDTFFGGSLSLAVSAMLERKDGKLSGRERRELQRMLKKAAEEGR
jgi:predicted transcriptional regulator